MGDIHVVTHFGGTCPHGAPMKVERKTIDTPFGQMESITESCDCKECDAEYVNNLNNLMRDLRGQICMGDTNGGNGEYIRTINIGNPSGPGRFYPGTNKFVKDQKE